jgi:hypothetical protein
MEHDLNWLKAMIATRANEMWTRENRPYYISYIAIDSAKEGVDYRDLIKPLKLRQWALTNEVDGLKVVEHPYHKAKIGFIPETADYVFEDNTETTKDNAEGAVAPSSSSSSNTKTSNIYLKTGAKTRRATLQFLEVLSGLDDDELDSINIPTRTIVRLLNG